MMIQFEGCEKMYKKMKIVNELIIILLITNLPNYPFRNNTWQIAMRLRTNRCWLL